MRLLGEGGAGRVWLVEDNEVFRRNVQRVINNLDEMVCDGSFDSAESSFIALQNQPAPDVILLDVQLPGISGLEVLRRMREMPGLAAVPVIIVSNHDFNGQELLELRQQVDNVLAKAGLSREQLKHVVRKAMEAEPDG